VHGHLRIASRCPWSVHAISACSRLVSVYSRMQSRKNDEQCECCVLLPSTFVVLVVRFGPTCVCVCVCVCLSVLLVTFE